MWQEHLQVLFCFWFARTLATPNLFNSGNLLVLSDEFCMRLVSEATHDQLEGGVSNMLELPIKQYA